MWKMENTQIFTISFGSHLLLVFHFNVTSIQFVQLQCVLARSWNSEKGDISRIVNLGNSPQYAILFLLFYLIKEEPIII